jgi:DNA repair exonuclease SbcCD ATPase subunit
MVKLVDSISRFSGEELRNEFGFKLAKLSSVLLNDIFNLDGEITLESNGLRTTFKYNDGNGFLSFNVLSGGQLQKIKLAINLALLLFFYKDRQYIFLDEVFQHLDNPSKGLLINYIVKELGIKNILLIQHDSLKFEGFKEIRVYRDENKNTKVV